MGKKIITSNCVINLIKNTNLCVLSDTNVKIVILNESKSQNNQAPISLNIEVLDHSKLELLLVSKDYFNLNIKINLSGVSSILNFNNIGLLKEAISSNKSIVVVHKGCDNYSRIQSFNLLNGESSLKEYCNVLIKKNTTGSDTYLKQRAFLLSPKASSSLLPTLQINNSQTKAGHGCAQGYFNKDAIFYLMSRGLSEDICIKILIDSYIRPLVSDFVSIGSFVEVGEYV